MKVSVCSDLHLEFGFFAPDAAIFKNEEQADVLVLGGDICVAAGVSDPKYRANLVEFFDRCSSAYKHVVYLMGNHEHYNGDFKYSAGTLFSLTCIHDNFHFLDNGYAYIDGVLFVGGTMWTDMNRGDPLTLHHMKSSMNDFQCVKNSSNMLSRKVPLYEDPSLVNEHGVKQPSGWKFKTEPSMFSPNDALQEHHKFLDYLRTMLNNSKDQKVVVCTHHTPSTLSAHPRYKHDTIMNGGYHSDLSELILDNPHIKLWTHGHTHEPFDYVLGETRVVCNPRGYIKYEPMASNFTPKIVEI